MDKGKLVLSQEPLSATASKHLSVGWASCTVPSSLACFLQVTDHHTVSETLSCLIFHLFVL